MSETLAELTRETVGDAALAVVERGSGFQVVLVHGSVSDLRTWEGLLAPLAQDYRVLAYSRRYAWPNAPIADGMPDPIVSHVEDLAGLIRSRGAKAHVVGHSWGGLIALLTAIRYPDLVGKLVLMEPPAFSVFMPLPPRPGPALRLFATRPRVAFHVLRFGAMGMAPAQAAFRRRDTEAAIRAFGRAILGKERFEGLSASRMAQVRDNIASERAQALHTELADITAAEVVRVAQPVLLLGAEESPALFRLTLDRLGGLLPRAEQATIGGASHIMHEDNPAATNAAILSFLEGRMES